MSINSTSFFHFTPSLDALLGILSGNFNVRFCRENIQFDRDNIEIFVPMVSFCRLPIRNIKMHTDKYGEYGIGLTEEWGIANNLSPAIYISEKSQLSSNLYTLISSLFGGVKFDQMHEKTKTQLDFVRFLKNYKSDLTRSNGLQIKDYKFADEQEWRYVPSNQDVPFFIDSKTGAHYGKEALNNSINKILEFEATDIQYIFIKNEDEIERVLDVIEKGRFSKTAFNNIKVLGTRIWTSEMIAKDF